MMKNLNEAVDPIREKIWTYYFIKWPQKPVNHLNVHHVVYWGNDLFKRALAVLAVERR
jgi:hypothetical protein